MSSQQVDYVVVGAGSAGCVVAARLTESGKHSVTLLEAGGEDKGFWITVPIGYGKLYGDPNYNWNYVGEPEPGLEGAKTSQPRGKVLGGTGSINGVVYMRGQREDFDYWRQLGNVGWSYDDVLPYFIKSEDNDRGANAYHGVGGPLGVTTQAKHELVEAFIAAGIQAGYKRNDDFNGAVQEGFGYNQATVRKGRRSSTARAFLHPARKRPNLNVVTKALATRILFEGRKAIGVEYLRGDKTETVMARREVIVCGGVFNAPQLLQLSGIGPGELLREFSIPVVHELKGVGENMQDHFSAAISYRCSKPITVNDYYNNPFRRYVMGIRYLLFHDGIMAGNANYAGGCIRTDPALEAPDVKLHLQMWSRSSGVHSAGRMALTPWSGFAVSMHLFHPESRGTVRIRSADPRDPPRMQFNFFLSRKDQEVSVASMQTIRKVMSMPAIKPYVVEETTPGPACSTHDDWIAFFRKYGRSNHHGSSTCKMGIDDMAVVDPRLRVHGVANLRVVDASIMPQIVAANTNAASIMIGEKGAAMILEDAG